MVTLSAILTEDRIGTKDQQREQKGKQEAVLKVQDVSGLEFEYR
jgi:hypothetical protein